MEMMIIHNAEAISPRFLTGDMVLVSELREACGMDSKEFDALLIQMAEKRIIGLHKFDRPYLISEEERGQMLQEDGKFYHTISYTAA